MFDLYFGVPEMRDFWIELNGKFESKTATKDEIRLHYQAPQINEQWGERAPFSFI